jgi:peptidoglycan/xylan/chitin deacetylase (PgdA/CDA1 family)
VTSERSLRSSWRSLAAALAFGLTVALLTVGVIAWQRSRARELALAAAQRRFPGSATVISVASRLPSATLGERVRVGILRDPASELYYDRRAMMDSIVGTWRAALSEIGAEARIVTPREAVDTHEEQVLIVPASPCLGRDARHALDVAVRRGTGLVVTWLGGVRDGGCRSVGFGLITEVSGASRLDTLESGRTDCYVTFLRGGPLAADIPPGARLELAVANHVALRVRQREAYFSDYMLNPRSARDEALVDGAVVQTAVGAARAVYWGFDLSLVANRPWDRAIALRLTRNSVAWAARLPLATIEPWPMGKTAAAVFAQDVEDEFDNARNALDSLQAAHVTGTFFLVSRLAQRSRSLSLALAAHGEVGSHTPRHRLLGGRAPAEQQAALDDTQRQLAGLVGHPIAGLRPPEEQFDAATLAAWRRAGGRYMFATLNGRAASPEILSTDNGALVMLGRVTNDDFIEVARRGLTNVDSLADGFLSAFEKVRALGGLYILSYHSQMLARPELVPALARVARRVVADSDTWVTTAGAVADWWLERSLVTARARFVDPRRVVLDVENNGLTAVTGAVVRVAIGNVDVLAADAGSRILSSDGDAVRVLLPALAPGARLTTALVLGRPADRRAERATPRKSTSLH